MAHCCDQISSPARSLLCLALAGVLCLVQAANPANAGDIHLLTYDGPITPVAAEFLIQGIDRAEDENAEAIVIQLDTPGGLDDSMRDIVKAELAAKIPVVIFVGPPGSRAASAGAFITIAAHVAAMAPETNIGSASPVQMGGAGMDSTMAHKVTNDAAAYIASIAERKGRNPELARTFVTEAANLTAEEALQAGVIDLVVPSIAALLDSLQGREIEVAGQSVTLDTADAVIIEHEMGPRQKLLKQLVNPNLAYILMMLGIYGLFFELSNPGSLVPGILGAICLLLALYAFQTLPVDYTGVALIIVGVIMLILEIKVPSYGVLSIGGLTGLVLGSLMLFDSPQQWAQLSLSVLIPSVAVFGGFFMLCVWLVVRGQKRPPNLGLAALVGETGRVVQPIAPGQNGKVVFHGEMWDATADLAIAADSQVTVISVTGRLARVVPAAAAGDSSSNDGS